MLVLAIVLGLVPSFAWLFFFMEEDTDSEPKTLIAGTFLCGAVFAFIALAAQYVLSSIFKYWFNFNPANNAHPIANTLLLYIIYITLFAFIEEVVKFSAAHYAIHRNPAFDMPIDAMIYMVVAALGFAAVENLAIVGGYSMQAYPFYGNLFETLSLRFVGATLLHALASAIVGYHWAISILKLRKIRYLIVGIIFATLLHTFFNYLIITYGNIIYPVLCVAIAGFFVLNDFEKLAVENVNIHG